MLHLPEHCSISTLDLYHDEVRIGEWVQSCACLLGEGGCNRAPIYAAVEAMTLVFVQWQVPRSLSRTLISVPALHLTYASHGVL